MASNGGRRPHFFLVSRTFGRWHGIGPGVYYEGERIMLHTWARYFRLPYHRGFKWRFHLRVKHGHMVSRVNVGNG